MKPSGAVSTSKPRGYWKEPSNHRAFFDSLGKRLNVKELDDWYKVLNKQVVRDNGGGRLLNFYRGSPYLAISSIYSEHKWIPWKFGTAPMGFWKDISNQKRFFDWLGKQLDVKEMDDWYKVLNKNTLIEHGGARLLRLYNDSPFLALSTVYPEHEWTQRGLDKAPQGYWKQDSQNTHLTRLISEISEKLHINRLDDWYRVSTEQLDQLRARAPIQKAGGLPAVLQKQYPNHNWDLSKFKESSKKAAQRWLYLVVTEIFPGQGILEDYLHPKIVFPDTQRPVQLDVYIPSLNLALEYQGEHHYHDVRVFGTRRNYQEKDSEKRRLCKEHNINLIEVPYWWDKKRESLEKMIQTGEPMPPLNK